MESKPKMLKYLDENSNKYKFQVEVEQTEEPNFVFYSFSYFSTSFGTFAYNNKYQEVNFSGKLKYNAEKGYYELNINKARQESRDVSIMGLPVQLKYGKENLSKKFLINYKFGFIMIPALDFQLKETQNLQ